MAFAGVKNEPQVKDLWLTSVNSTLTAINKSNLFETANELVPTKYSQHETMAGVPTHTQSSLSNFHGSTRSPFAIRGMLSIDTFRSARSTALSVTSLLDLASAQAFRDDKKQWDEENSEHGRCDHAAKNRRSHGVAGGGAGAMRNDQRK
jgi:hypothetical protein